VSVGDRPEEAPVSEASSKLIAGLKSCRAVIENYRSLLTKEASTSDRPLSGQETMGDNLETPATEARGTD
jgi:hypothetical protein